ncbi:putative glycosyltransferase [Cavenderia fasciculata]|uniref:Glycosyltransferase n=1 Tax=Cavenderia fasciculata TaxID=261658 RepID=F4Q7C5_CACFS|nr:putative glycosyltransferase [Cavenderia fasciculata]EGG16307.1 putative glycosyltransferase [Cavenderia fasciculata]|eukprot:XP_004354691.1 putative glycosyltransferase [Cavenderia fasciculata]
MKIVFYAIGSRGDVQPSCVLVTEERLKYLVDQFEGLEFWPVQGDGCKPLFDCQMQSMLNDDVNRNLEYVYNERKILDLCTPGRLQTFYDASTDVDMIVPSALTITEAVCVMSFTKYNVIEVERVEKWRANELKLGTLKDPFRFMSEQNQNVILAFSERLLPGDKVPSDYFSKWHLTGFLFPKPNVFKVPDKILRFLDNGKKQPIVFSLGSMPTPNPLNIYTTLRSVVRKLSTQVIIIKGWTVFDDMQDDESCIFVDAIDHNWLFKQCSCIIHHGGVGTTAAAWKSGTPSLVTWMYFDQPFWGKRTTEIGCGKSLRLQSINETNLYNSLKEILQNPSYKARAMEVAHETNKTDGAAQAANIIEQSFQQYQQHQHLQSDCSTTSKMNDDNNINNNNMHLLVGDSNINNNTLQLSKSVTTLISSSPVDSPT